MTMMTKSSEPLELWSFLRNVLSQGGAIQQDYDAGKYNCYEEYSIRLDGAARERAEQLEAIIKDNA